MDRFDQPRTSVRVVDLVAEEVDVALRVGKVGRSGLVARRVATPRMATCASPGYLASAGVPRTIEELRGHRGIGGRSSLSGRPRDWRQRAHVLPDA